MPFLPQPGLFTFLQALKLTTLVHYSIHLRGQNAGQGIILITEYILQIINE